MDRWGIVARFVGSLTCPALVHPENTHSHGPQMSSAPQQNGGVNQHPTTPSTGAFKPRLRLRQSHRYHLACGFITGPNPLQVAQNWVHSEADSCWETGLPMLWAQRTLATTAIQEG